tara:strand:+ start:1329 stop:1532 length:204 start_codon:yes stop_codon:yes gene_type:complete
MADLEAVKSRLEELIEQRQEIANSLQQLSNQRIDLEGKFQQHNGAIAALQELVPEDTSGSSPADEGE